MSPASTATAWSEALGRAVLHARVATSVIRRDLSPSGWLGIALVGLSVVAAVAALSSWPWWARSHPFWAAG